MLSHALLAKAGRPWRAALEDNRRCHRQTDACCQVLQASNSDNEDWPLLVLRLRAAAEADGASHTKLSHSTPIQKKTRGSLKGPGLQWV